MPMKHHKEQSINTATLLRIGMKNLRTSPQKFPRRNFEAVRFHHKFRMVTAAIFPITYFHIHAPLHRFYHLAQYLSFGRNVFKQYPAVQASRLAHYVAHCQCRKHPLLHCVIAQKVIVFYKIAVVAIAANHNVKYFFYRCPVPVKRRAAQRLSLAQHSVLPTVIQLRQRYPLRPPDGIHHPYVLFKKCRCFHISPICPISPI